MTMHVRLASLCVAMRFKLSQPQIHMRLHQVPFVPQRSSDTQRATSPCCAAHPAPAARSCAAGGAKEPQRQPVQLSKLPTTCASSGSTAQTQTANRRWEESHGGQRLGTSVSALQAPYRAAALWPPLSKPHRSHKVVGWVLEQVVSEGADVRVGGARAAAVDEVAARQSWVAKAAGAG